MYDRYYSLFLEKRLTRPFVDIVFGARQTGKTTLLKSLLAPSATYNLVDPRERSRLLADPGRFANECEALPIRDDPHVVFVDEAQLVPSVFDAVQMLYDKDKLRWKFVLCGSGARKLRRMGANLLPGRSILHRLHPLTLYERPTIQGTPGQIAPLTGILLNRPFPPADLEERLAYGDLPGIVTCSDEEERCLLLESYVELHLQDEIRREGLVKDWGLFVNFLKLAARESGCMINYANISRNVGISIPTVKSHYQLLEDMFIGFRVPAFSGSFRKTALLTPRFIFFDIGVRHASAGIPPGKAAVAADPGGVFEQWVGMELHRRMDYSKNGELFYMRTKAGAEIDYIIKRENEVVPIEVKWTDRPSIKDARHLLRFIEEAPHANHGYVVCRCPRPRRIADTVTALPWQNL